MECVPALAVALLLDCGPLLRVAIRQVHHQMKRVIRAEGLGPYVEDGRPRDCPRGGATAFRQANVSRIAQITHEIGSTFKASQAPHTHCR